MLTLTAKRDIQVIATGRKEAQIATWQPIYQPPINITDDVLNTQLNHGFKKAKQRYIEWMAVANIYPGDVAGYSALLELWLKEHKAAGYTFEFGAT